MKRPSTHQLSLFILAIIQIMLVWLWAAPGPLSIDEVNYQWMARSTLDGQLLTLSNGYEDFPVESLVPFLARSAGGHITPQYPPYYAWIVAPFYALFGLYGLLLVNALAFVGVLGLTHRIAIQLLDDPGIGRVAMSIMGLGTFAWEYSMGAWPHMLALLFSLGALSLSLDILQYRRGAGAAVLSGLLVGVGLGIRLDVALFAPVVFLPLLLSSPTRWRALCWQLVGVLPPVLGLSLSNYIKWNSISPLHYGMKAGYTSLSGNLFIIALGLLGLFVLWMLSRPRARVLTSAAMTRVASNRSYTSVAAVLCLVVLGLVIVKFRGLGKLLFDLRGEPTNFGGRQVQLFAVIYFGGLKMALIQSLPWLPILLLAVQDAVKNPPRRLALALCSIVPLTLLFYFSRNTWHGGMGTNLRYFLPVLPFLSILGAWSLMILVRRSAPRWWRIPAVAALLVLAVYFLRRPQFSPTDDAATMLDLPHLIASAVVVLVLMKFRLSSARLDKALIIAMVVGLSWSMITNFDYCARWSYRTRQAHLEVSEITAAHLEEHSLLFTSSIDYFATVGALRQDVVLAFPYRDQYKSMEGLTAFHLSQGRHVYLALQEGALEALQAEGILGNYPSRVISDHPVFIQEILPKTRAANLDYEQ